MPQAKGTIKSLRAELIDLGKITTDMDKAEIRSTMKAFRKELREIGDGSLPALTSENISEASDRIEEKRQKKIKLFEQMTEHFGDNVAERCDKAENTEVQRNETVSHDGKDHVVKRNEFELCKEIDSLFSGEAATQESNLTSTSGYTIQELKGFAEEVEKSGSWIATRRDGEAGTFGKLHFKRGTLGEQVMLELLEDIKYLCEHSVFDDTRFEESSWCTFAQYAVEEKSLYFNEEGQYSDVLWRGPQSWGFSLSNFKDTIYYPMLGLAKHHAEHDLNTTFDSYADLFSM